MFKINKLLSCIIFYNVYIIIIYQAWLSNRLTTSDLGTYYGKERKSLPSRYRTQLEKELSLWMKPN